MKTIVKYFAAVIMAAAPLFSMAQAKKPTIMVVPADTWCYENGYMETYDMQGKTTRVPSYEAAVQENSDLLNVITKVGELMADKGFPLKDLAATIRNINQSSAEDEMTVSRTSGSTLAETPLDRLLNRAKADIVVEIAWKLTKVGPKNAVTYTLRGIDAYTGKQVAAAQGTTEPSFSAEVPVLLEEAAVHYMDNFASQLMAHFEDLAENGREVVINIRVFDNGSGLCLEDEYDGEMLTDIIDNWMAQNTVKHRYSLTDATEYVLRFEQVRIPLYRENGNAMDTRYFVNNLRKYLAKQPFGLDSKILTKGLGRADLVLGEK